jgi:hypothetical protein
MQFGQSLIFFASAAATVNEWPQLGKRYKRGAVLLRLGGFRRLWWAFRLQWKEARHGLKLRFMVNWWHGSPFNRWYVVFGEKVVKCLAEKALQVFFGVLRLDKAQARRIGTRKPTAQVCFALPVRAAVCKRRGLDLRRFRRGGAFKPLLQIFQ